jgi:YfiH family protein
VSADGLSAALPGGGRVLFSSRADGNVSSVGGEAAHAGADARERLRVRCDLTSLVRGYQVHGAEVRIADTIPRAEPDQAMLPRCDGHAIAIPGVGAMVLAADCMPVALGCRGAVAMIHAGWRGLAAGVLERGVAAVRELAGPRAEIHAVIGPAAGVCCYEVGPEVHAAVGHDGAPAGPIDLRGLARLRLLEAGVVRVDDVAACTICDPRFFSHRREGARAGRQAGIAWLS